jgi:hypothetical protein
MTVRLEDGLGLTGEVVTPGPYGSGLASRRRRRGVQLAGQEHQDNRR